MTDVVADVKADAAAVVADVKADVASVETKAKSFWNLTLHPWLTHAVALVSGYVAAHFGLVSVLAKFL